ncbi:hypothetical protein DM860_000127 [Cuscuta australis]|uniref:C2H2-type domain-containing protein n=1 Tax=Cuscuta australis TaxID=267555 RepID=A0A328D0N5_9ASTE|nr:hypothetical protein DM860_000127 [Cuscuta australis]
MTVMMKRSRREVAAAVEALAMANCLILLESRSEAARRVNSTSEWDFQCKTCKKRFQSFQALGGHMSSHKRPKTSPAVVRKDDGGPEERKRHECPVCGLVYGLGQALGGHMRKHRAEERIRATEGKKLENGEDEYQKTDKINWNERDDMDKIRGVGLFDLNLLPNDDDDDDSIEDERVDDTRGLADFPKTTLDLLI